MDWQAAVVILGGALGQFLKTFKNVPTWIPQAGMFAVGVLGYVAFNPPHVNGVSAYMQYAIVAAVSALSVNGAASIVGLHPALKTDSK